MKHFVNMLTNLNVNVELTFEVKTSKILLYIYVLGSELTLD